VSRIYLEAREESSKPKTNACNVTLREHREPKQKVYREGETCHLVFQVAHSRPRAAAQGGAGWSILGAKPLAMTNVAIR
jgi:hypothetical protein